MDWHLLRLPLRAFCEYRAYDGVTVTIRRCCYGRRNGRTYRYQLCPCLNEECLPTNDLRAQRGPATVAWWTTSPPWTSICDFSAPGSIERFCAHNLQSASTIRSLAITVFHQNHRHEVSPSYRITFLDRAHCCSIRLVASGQRTGITIIGGQQKEPQL
jgi:hypothetical protein